MSLAATLPAKPRPRRLLPRIAPWLWLLPAIAVFVPFFIYPIGVLFRYSFNRDDPVALMVPDFTPANYLNVLTDPYYVTVFTNSLGVAAAVTLFTLLLGYPFAYFLVRYAKKSRNILIWAVYTPLIVSVIVRAFGWIVITADTGLINAALLGAHFIEKPLRLLFEIDALLMAMTHRYFPLMVLPLVNAIARIDPALYSASANLGAGRLRTFFKVVVPLSIPGIVAGTQLVFANVLSDFVMPNLIGSARIRLLAPAIYEEAAVNVAWATAATLATVMLVVVCAVLLLSNAVYRRLAPWAKGI